MLSLYEILKASKTGIAPDLWTALAAKNCSGDSGAEVKELTGIPPLSIRSNGTMLLDYLISGNMVRTGTPTPQNPIQPQECGERTDNIANLYGVDKTSMSLNLKTGDNMTIIINGTKTAGANIISVAYPNITLPAGTYTVKIKMVGGTISNITGGAIFGINASTYAMRTAPQVSKVGDIGIKTFTLTEDTLLTSLDITPSYGDVGSVWDNATFECWLYSGYDDIPYEPYGYKLPITSAGQTNNIYLGEVPTTRKIKKVVLTGDETWTLQSINSYDIANFWNRSISSIIRTLFVTHFKYQTTSIANTTDEGFLYEPSNSTIFFRIDSTTASTVDEFKSWLAEQNANGTPVTLWYVLATPETGIANEPLRKIGDYADTVSMEQAGVNIPTVSGANVIDVETTLKPSEMYIKYQE